MRRKPREVDFEAESEAALAAVRAMVGQQVPVSAWYVAGTHPTLIAVANDLCTLRYANGAVMYNVPIRDLVDNLSYWKIYRREPDYTVHDSERCDE